ncbi:hypothetical protein COV17_01380 [Candidatus Woesearchaeota archaeon CG10_big_fil_rev_8_21_14_0_10_36_11]|nr:MAG: hypothetical protein COV17_01380 [Candidatus Woesearchaeota archaeon CG10_big_fil_rev_8_21_14_0_10_36_11]
MYKIPLSELKEKIIASGQISATEIDGRIKAKINELSGLISEEGAAHIIANELGITLVPQGGAKLKIKEIYAGMRNVTMVGKVVRLFEMREFSKGESVGKVQLLLLGDETGTLRVVFWNDQVDEIKNVKEDDIISLKDVYVKENNGNKEVHFGDRASIEINPEGETITSVRKSTSYERKSIKDLHGGEENTEIMGTVVQVFDPRFFTVCPECNKRVTEDQCATHGAVKPSFSYVMNTVIDDGTGNIRVVFWKNQTNHLLAKTEEQIVEYKDNAVSFEDVKTELLGEQFKLLGRVQKNDMFARLEFHAQIVEKADPEEELVRLEKE